MSTTTLLPGVPIVESPLFETFLRERGVSASTLKIANQLRNDGFAIIDFPDPRIHTMADRIISALQGQYDWTAWRAGKKDSLRVQDAWRTLREVKQIASNPALLQLLAELYGRKAFPFQTLNFPVGTQQHAYSDSVHFSSHPERFMVGVWVALEDIDSDNGPLIYYPKSHHLPIFTNEHIGVNPDTQGPNPYSHYPLYERTWDALVETLGLRPLEFHAKKGQALIWAANLLHGGAAQRDMSRTRWSQVTHYFFEDCVYHTPLGSEPFLGAIHYRDVTDVGTGKPVPNSVNKVKVSPDQLRYAKPSNHKLNLVEVPADFDSAAYLRANPDVAAAKVDPKKHYVEFGYYEGRVLR